MVQGSATVYDMSLTPSVYMPMHELKVLITFEVRNVKSLRIVKRAASGLGTRAGSAVRCSAAAAAVCGVGFK